MFTLIFAIALASHPGGLDANGCHNDHKHGGYHCHGGGVPPATASSSPPIPTPPPTFEPEGSLLPPTPEPAIVPAPEAAEPPASGSEVPAPRSPSSPPTPSLPPPVPSAELATDDGYPEGLLMEQILWGGLTYLGGEFVVVLCPPLVFGLPFASAYTVSEMGVSKGLEGDVLLPGLAAFGAAIGAGLCTWGVAIGICATTGAFAGTVVASAPVFVALGFYVLGGLAQPFVASAAAALTFKARAKRLPNVGAVVKGRDRKHVVAMAY